MIKFLIKSIMLCGICTAAVYMTIIFISPRIRNFDVYIAAALDKEKRLDSLSSPRLIFVGGSNLAFGLNCKKIEENMGIPTVNMGLHGSLGLSFMLNEAKAGLKKGDIVVLSIEYYLDEGEKKVQAQLIDLNSIAITYFQFGLFDKIKYFAMQFQRCISSSFYVLLGKDINKEFYNRHIFSPEGDVVAHLSMESPKMINDRGKLNESDYLASIKKINNFIRIARIRGACVYFVYPSYPRSEYELNRKAIERLHIQYAAQLTCPILGGPTDFVYPDNYFFDTVYHLNKAGREKRTATIIKLLRDKACPNNVPQ